MSEQTPDAKNTELTLILGQMQQLFDPTLSGPESEAQIRAFIDERIATLSESASDERISTEQTGVSDFIVGTRRVASGSTTNDFLLDDPSAYVPLIVAAKQFYHILQTRPQFAPPDKQTSLFINAAIRGANFGQARYFGSIQGDPRKLFGALWDILDDETPPNQAVSISTIGEGAMCAQRAALVHNTLKILGVDSRLLFGKLAILGENGDSAESHAVVEFMAASGDTYLLDPANPNIVTEKDGTVSNLLPTLARVDLQQSSTTYEQKQTNIVDGQEDRSVIAKLIFTPNQ